MQHHQQHSGHALRLAPSRSPQPPTFNQQQCYLLSPAPAAPAPTRRQPPAGLPQLHPHHRHVQLIMGVQQHALVHRQGAGLHVQPPLRLQALYVGPGRSQQRSLLGGWRQVAAGLLQQELEHLRAEGGA